MQELAKAVYLEDVLFGKKDSKERAEIESFIELVTRMKVDELVTHVNGHLATRMFLVGSNITAADIVVHLRMATHFRDLKDWEKLELPNAFRWIDHLQHLPGMMEQVENLGIFVSFPNENSEKETMTKAQLKKLAKEQW
jgi:glutathione S-transferase